MSLLSPRRVGAAVVSGLAASMLAVPTLTAPAAAVPATAEPGCAVGAPATIQNADVFAIPDPVDNVVESTIVVPTPGRIAWIRVRTDITHAFSSDVTAWITSPSGTRILLTDGNGDILADVFDGTWWDDDAGDTAPPGSVVEADYEDGVTVPLVAPEQALTTVRGEQVTGAWTLSVEDAFLPVDGGSLNGWALEYALYTGDRPAVATMHSAAGSTGPVPVDVTGNFNAPVSTPATGTIDAAELELTLDNNDNELAFTRIWLVSPSGTEVTLNRFSLTGPNPHLVYSDLGPTSFGDKRTPLEPLAALRGENPNGAWTLIVNPDNENVVVTGWKLTFGLASCGTETKLTASSAADHVPQGSTAAYAVTARNVRSAVVDDARVTLAVPAGTQLVSAAGSQGSCTGAVCSLGVLEPGGAASVVFLLKALTPGVVTPTATLTQSVTDVTPSDNVVTFTTTIDAPALAPAPADTVKPGLVMTLDNTTLAKAVKRGVPALLGGTEAGKLQLTLKVSAATAKALGVGRKLGTASATLTKAGTLKVRVEPKKKYADELLAATKPVRFTVTGNLTDAAGNVGKGKASNTYASAG